LFDGLRGALAPEPSIALHRAARARAWLLGRDYVSPEDVQALAPLVLRHRLVLSYDALAEGVDSDAVIAELIAVVAVG
jgi:MoxR-like ATPases